MAGISAYLNLPAHQTKIIVERRERLLGHSGSTSFKNYWLDEGAHICHSTNEEWLALLNLENVFQRDKANVKNWDSGNWIGYPIQNNLCDLSENDRFVSFQQILNNYQKSSPIIRDNYFSWLVQNYGQFLTENYYTPFTMKYWRTKSTEMGTHWLSGRVLNVDMEQIQKGLQTGSTSQAVFASFKYPRVGGFADLFQKLTSKINESDIRLNVTVTNLNLAAKTADLSDGTIIKYDKVLYSAPLNEYYKIASDAPLSVADACSKLRYTKLYQIAVELDGVSALDIPDWFYVYDQDIDISRVFNISSATGCTEANVVLQCETYRRDDETANPQQIKNDMIRGIQKIIPEATILDTRFEVHDFAYMVPLLNTQENVQHIHEQMKSCNIFPIGIYGKWEYMWSDVTYMDTKKEVSKL